MEPKVTEHTLAYPQGLEPDFIVPAEYMPYRFLLGKKGSAPLVALCMNPSAAREEVTDMTIYRIVRHSERIGADGWCVLNTYPERATDAKRMDAFNQELSDENIAEIKKYLLENNIKEVWGAWGDDRNLKHLRQGRQELLSMFKSIGVKVYYFGTLTKQGNPRHPLQRFEKWDYSKKNYLEF